MECRCDQGFLNGQKGCWLGHPGLATPLMGGPGLEKAGTWLPVSCWAGTTPPHPEVGWVGWAIRKVLVGGAGWERTQTTNETGTGLPFNPRTFDNRTTNIEGPRRHHLASPWLGWAGVFHLLRLRTSLDGMKHCVNLGVAILLCSQQAQHITVQ